MLTKVYLPAGSKDGRNSPREDSHITGTSEAGQGVCVVLVSSSRGELRSVTAAIQMLIWSQTDFHKLRVTSHASTRGYQNNRCEQESCNWAATELNPQRNWNCILILFFFFHHSKTVKSHSRSTYLCAFSGYIHFLKRSQRTIPIINENIKHWLKKMGVPCFSCCSLGDDLHVNLSHKLQYVLLLWWPPLKTLTSLSLLLGVFVQPYSFLCDACHQKSSEFFETLFSLPYSTALEMLCVRWSDV